ncbi:NADP-dependent oxidoreductase [Levilactobacillus lanxiensis]|uniref:NADP-dependent oxidoreductase n=1 Tax=Levilactobacillus lanxiensis TaxID=2799568 RepID=A0ABW4D2I8_9LACO|nr:NADP-dependent oxidoreductase [Levilactobacillus lanxiensis]
MKEILLREYGSVDGLFEVDTAMPTIAADEVLVKLVATGVNDVDVVIRKNGFPATVQNQAALPHSLGTDFSGIITQTGSQVTKFVVGDHVVGLNTLATYAEYVAINENALISKVPQDLDLVPLGGLLGTALPAWSAVVLEGKVQANQKVLIHGGAGGVGSMAIQFAKAAGAYVITTAAAKDEDYVTALGADQFIDYRHEDFGKIVKDVDLVVHLVDKATQDRSYSVIKPGGKLLSPAVVPDQELAKKYNVEAKFIWGDVSEETRSSVVDLYAHNQLDIHVNQIYPFTLAGVKIAQSDFEKGPNRGKRIIKFSD